MDISKIVENTIVAQSLIKKGEKVLVALSGGADSALLFRILCGLRDKYGFTVGAAHINHQLRDTADRDEEFARSLAKELGAEFYVKKADVKKLSAQAKMGEEQFARALRYEFFASLGYDKIATAHNRNDVAETVLFNLMRGAGVKGLSGIAYQRDNIIRPLLDVKKEDVLEYSKKMGYSFVTDETNAQAIYSRNKIRLELIPEIEKKFNPSFVDVVAENAKHIKEDSDFLDEMARECYNGQVTCEMASCLKKPIFSRICNIYYKEVTGTDYNLPGVYLDKIAELVKKNKTGSLLHLPLNVEAKMEYGRLIMAKKTDKIEFCYKIVPGIVLEIPEIGKNILIEQVQGKGDFYLDDENDLTVRSRRQGDWFCPVGMDGRKKLSDYFTDKKIPAKMRDSIPLLYKGEDLVSVVGYRQDRRFALGGTAYKIRVTEEYNAD